MKKVLLAASAALVLMFVVASCKSVEDKANDYVNQMKELVAKGDYEAAMKLAEEAEAWYEGLSDADKAIVDAMDVDF